MGSSSHYFPRIENLLFPNSQLFQQFFLLRIPITNSCKLNNNIKNEIAGVTAGVLDSVVGDVVVDDVFELEYDDVVGVVGSSVVVSGLSDSRMKESSMIPGWKTMCVYSLEVIATTIFSSGLITIYCPPNPNA